MRRLWILALLGCGGSPPPPLTHHATPAPAPAPVATGPCAGTLHPHRETLVRGRETEIAAFGKRATYHGESIDHFADGTSAFVLSLDVFGEPWLPDSRDRGIHPFGEHCIRLIASSATALELDVALQPAHEYDSHRCHMGCCVTPDQQKPSPDGHIECCFCDDDPSP